MANKTFLYLIIVMLMITLVSCKENLDPSIANTLFGLTALKYEFIIALLSLISGYTMVLGGLVLICLGLNGNIEWIIEASDFQSRLLNASPGLVLALAGALLIWRSRMNIKVTKDQSDKAERKQCHRR